MKRSLIKSVKKSSATIENRLPKSTHLELKKVLDSALATYHKKNWLSTDPVEYVHRFRNPHDQEAVALLAAVISYGNVKQIRGSIEQLLGRIASRYESPSVFIRAMGDPKGREMAESVLSGFVHRFTRDFEIAAWAAAIAQAWQTHQTFGAFFLKGLESHVNIESAQIAMIDEIRTKSPLLKRSYLLTSPAEASPCKRWMMFLRWMGRHDEIDPGLWAGKRFTVAELGGKVLRPSQLVMPLDTHTGRLSQQLQMTQRKSLNWKAALEVTDCLKQFDANDPIKYDFALMRVGMIESAAPRKKRERKNEKNENP